MAVPALFTDSRRLLGPSLWLDVPGVVLEAPLPHGRDDAVLRAWGGRVTWMCAAMGWTDTAITIRSHSRGSSLAFSAPPDALMSATSLNEWALQSAAEECGVAYDAASLEPERLPLDQPAALALLREFVARERDTPPADAAPLPPRDIPIALVTGSNGKTTTTRLIAAMLREAGHVVGYSCTDGVVVGNEVLERGDWSGPGGARRVLEDSRVTAAVLESARGGLLRRGLIVPRATAAVITNIAADHFGDYGIESLADIASAKSVVAKALDANGTLVLNGDDPTLATLQVHSPARIERFGTGPQASGLLPPLAEIPIAMNGHAAYNVANAEAAARVARALGVPADAIAAALRRFGRDNADNAGRLERYERNGVRIWVDYAHNPHGLTALMSLAQAERGSGRVGLLLGQAGDRSDDALRELAATAWRYQPDMVVLQEMEYYRRGRAMGEVPAILEAELRRNGASDAALRRAANESEGVAILLDWSRPGDLLVLPVHALDVRERVTASLRDRVE